MCGHTTLWTRGPGRPLTWHHMVLTWQSFSPNHPHPLVSLSLSLASFHPLQVLLFCCVYTTLFCTHDTMIPYAFLYMYFIAAAEQTTTARDALMLHWLHRFHSRQSVRCPVAQSVKYHRHIIPIPFLLVSSSPSSSSPPSSPENGNGYILLWDCTEPEIIWHCCCCCCCWWWW